MKRIVKKKLSVKKLIIILSSVFALLLCAAIILGVWYTSREEEKPEVVYPEILDGEALKYNQPIAYPEIEIEKIQGILIRNKHGSFDFIRPEKDESFEMWYTDKNGDKKLYYPEIYKEDSSFVYDSLYAVENSDGFSMIPRLTYLCSAISVNYFDSRITLSSDPSEREKELRMFGLSDDRAQFIAFSYLDEDGKESQHTIRIGDGSLSGEGFYYMVDDREHVYTTSYNSLSYGLLTFEDYVKPILIAAGISSDNGQAPYFTTGYYQWLGKLYAKEGDEVVKGARVIVYADRIIPDEKGEDGYISDGYSELEFDLSSLAGKDAYKSLVNALIGKKVGAYCDTGGDITRFGDEIIVTLSTPSKSIDFKESDEIVYKYEISRIEAIITDGADVVAEGTRVGDNNLIRVTYRLSVDGGEYSGVSHAVFDLSSKVYAEDAVAALRASTVGSLSEKIELSVKYTKANAYERRVKYVIEEIISVYGQNGKKQDKIDGESIVSYRYYLEEEGGVRSESITAVLDLSKATGEDDKPIRDALIGKGQSHGLSILVKEAPGYYEHARSFYTYKIQKINYFVENSIVTAYRFQKESERDPYYGESLYENLMTGKYSLYGLSSAVCERVVKILGGLSDTTTSGTGQGLVGTETVAVGLTPAVMKEYGLYAHTIHFELPSQHYSYYVDMPDGTKVEEMGFYETVTYTIYISDEQIDGTRYIASDLYDVVTRVDGENFIFLDFEFVEFWARRYMILMDFSKIENVNIEFMMEDVVGKYNFEIDTTEKSAIISATPEGECTENKLTEFLAKHPNYSFVSLGELYNYYVGGGQDVNIGSDSMGTTYFKEALLGIYFTQYQDVMPEDERAEAESPEKLLFRLKLDIVGTAYNYVYEFYRADDRRVLVRIFREDFSGNMRGEAVDDFYISTLAFKKMIGNFVSVLNAEEFDRDVAYPEKHGE